MRLPGTLEACVPLAPRRGAGTGTAVGSTVRGPGSSGCLCSHSVQSLEARGAVGSVRADVSPPPPDLSLNSSHPGGTGLTPDLSQRMQMNREGRGWWAPRSRQACLSSLLAPCLGATRDVLRQDAIRTRVFTAAVVPPRAGTVSGGRGAEAAFLRRAARGPRGLPFSSAASRLGLLRHHLHELLAKDGRRDCGERTESERGQAAGRAARPSFGGEDPTSPVPPQTSPHLARLQRRMGPELCVSPAGCGHGTSQGSWLSAHSATLSCQTARAAGRAWEQVELPTPEPCVCVQQAHRAPWWPQVRGALPQAPGPHCTRSHCCPETGLCR